MDSHSRQTISIWVATAEVPERSPLTENTHSDVCIVGAGMTGHAQDPEHWRDSHYRVQGPVVTQMQSVFMDNRIKVSGDVLHGPRTTTEGRVIIGGEDEEFVNVKRKPNPSPDPSRNQNLILSKKTKKTSKSKSKPI